MKNGNVAEETHFYILETAENKEFYIKSKITALFPQIKVTIPIEKSKVKINGVEFIYFNRLTPDYLLLQCETMSSKCLERLNDIDGVVSVMSEKAADGARVPSEVPANEAARLMSEFSRDQILAGNKEISIILGQYAGYTGKILKEYADEALISLNTKRKLRVKVPIWYIGKNISSIKKGA